LEKSEKKLWLNLRQNCDTCPEGIRETTKCQIMSSGRDMNSVPAKYEAELIGINQLLTGLHAGTNSSEERGFAIFRNIIS
jgi:hypothetical protein